jgi:hypothetical protein
MATYSSDSRSRRSRILDHLRTLRTDIEQARNALLHFKSDRVDRDRLEPAARRVDQLMDIFSKNVQGPQQASGWVSEIQHDVDQVTNPKAAYALGHARQHIVNLLDAMRLHATSEKPEH